MLHLAPVSVKLADELRRGDIVTIASQRRGRLRYRVLATQPGLGLTTVRVIGECLTTGRRHTLDFFRMNRVEVGG